MDSDLLRVAAYVHQLDLGSRQCHDMCRDLQAELSARHGGHLASTDEIAPELLEAVLVPFGQRYYRAVARTLFNVLRIMQPADFAAAPVNFYFWPAYHSYFLKKRLFYRGDDSAVSLNRLAFGVGLCGDPAAGDPHQYQQCCQAAWYELATTRAQNEAYPASPYQWGLAQRPRAPRAEDGYLASVTFTTSPGVQGLPQFTHHQVRNLGDRPFSSRTWGWVLADLLNSLDRDHPDWEFPERRDREQAPDYDPQLEQRLRDVRLLLISLWMHSVFCGSMPEWWDSLIAAVRVQGLTKLEGRLQGGLYDGPSCDWGDRSQGRPPFTTWTSLLLEPLVAPPPGAIVGPSERERTIAPDERARNIGWATMLCSVPLSVPFIMVARRWLMTVYATLRNAEISVLLKEREGLSKAALAADVLFHDLRKFIIESQTPVLRRSGDCSREATEYRQFVMYALNALTDLINGVCGAAPFPDKMERVRERFLRSLLVPSDYLLGVLDRAAADVQKFRYIRNAGTVDLAAAPELSSIVNRNGWEDTYVTCLILVGEVIRNYVQYGPAGSTATLTREITGGRLRVVLRGPVEGKPVSHTYDVLHTFLELVCGGSARCTSSGTDATWCVELELPRGTYGIDAA